MEWPTIILPPTVFITTKVAYAISTSVYAVALEWQKRINGRGPIFLSAGLEAEIRHGIHSKVKYDGHKETIDKGLNVRPVGLNLLVARRI